MTVRHLRGGGSIVGTADELAAHGVEEDQLGIAEDTGAMQVGSSVLPSGGGEVTPQIAAKSTDMTPPGGPGLFALTSTDVEDGGWYQMNLDATSARLTLGTHDGASNLDLLIQQDPSPYMTFIAQAVNDDQSLQAQSRMVASANDDVAAAQSGVDCGDSSALLIGNTTEGSYLQISPKAGQTHRLVVVNSDQYDSGEFPAPIPAFAVDIDGPILFSPNGTGYRLLVSNGGVLSTQAV